MKTPVCPRCMQANTLKLVDLLTGPALTSVAAIRCMKTSGGCGEVFAIHKLVATDSSGLVKDLYRESGDPAIAKPPRAGVQWSTPRREPKP